MLSKLFNNTQPEPCKIRNERINNHRQEQLQELRQIKDTFYRTQNAIGQINQTRSISHSSSNSSSITLILVESFRFFVIPSQQWQWLVKILKHYSLISTKQGNKINRIIYFFTTMIKMFVIDLLLNKIMCGLSLSMFIRQHNCHNLIKN